MTQTEPTAEEVIQVIRNELTAGSMVGGRSASVRAHLRRARELQRAFRNEPIGGRLSGLKRAFHWWTASAFDRQAKAIEALLDAVEELAARQELRPIPRSAAAGDAAHSLVDASLQGLSPGPPRHALSLPAALEVSAEMLRPEQVLLYGLVYGLRPSRSLEIGTFQGGSAALICAALEDAFGDDMDHGRLICIDPEPRVLPAAQEWMERRATVLKGPSPDLLAEARDLAGGPFAFAFIDGDHSDQGVLRDIEGSLEHLMDEAYLLFHDCHFAHVRDGIDEALRRHPELVDAGVLSTSSNPLDEVDDQGRPVVWGGMRLLRLRRSGG